MVYFKRIKLLRQSCSELIYHMLNPFRIILTIPHIFIPDSQRQTIIVIPHPHPVMSVDKQVVVLSASANNSSFKAVLNECALMVFINTFPSGISLRASFDSTMLNSLNLNIYNFVIRFKFSTATLSTPPCQPSHLSSLLPTSHLTPLSSYFLLLSSQFSLLPSNDAIDLSPCQPSI